jgi:N-acetylmuramoyl-L-alanine amidase
MKILIDNGHGDNTPGKRSPDGKLLEWQYTRRVAKVVAARLERAGYDVELLTPENYDVKLIERVHRANVKAQSLGRKNVIVVSIHCNAAGSQGEWMKATGWEAWTSPGRTDSDTLAECLYQAAKQNLVGQAIREYKPQDKERDKEAKFTILQDTLCPAVLTENLFMDNRKDVKYLLSDDGFEAIVRTHVEGIINYINTYENNNQETR